MQVAEFGRKQTGLDQYAIVKFAEAFEIVPRMLAENSGLNATDVVSGWGTIARGPTLACVARCQLHISAGVVLCRNDVLRSGGVCSLACTLALCRDLCMHARVGNLACAALLQLLRIKGRQWITQRWCMPAAALLCRHSSPHTALPFHLQVSALYAAHSSGQQGAGINLETGAAEDLRAAGVVDVYTTKWWAIKLATEAVATVLKVDQIIMAKQAGGPKPRGMDGDDD
jgi:hypothetical protein